MLGVQPSRWDFAPTGLVPGEGVWGFLEYPDATTQCCLLKCKRKPFHVQ